MRSPRAEAGQLEPGVPPWAATIMLSRGALASSGAARRWWRVDGVVRHHLLDPRTGLPMTIWTGADLDRPSPHALAMVTALAPTAERAEVAAKLALLRGYDAAKRAIESAWAREGANSSRDNLDADVALIFTFSDGAITPSANVRAWLTSYGSAGAAIPLYVEPSGIEALPPLTGLEA
jgi:thiamine biosynthesis lipoprotein